MRKAKLKQPTPVVIALIPEDLYAVREFNDNAIRVEFDRVVRLTTTAYISPAVKGKMAGCLVPPSLRE